MAKMSKGEGLMWNEVDPDTMPAAESKLYKDYKAKQKIASEAADKFNESFKKLAAKKIAINLDKQSILISHRFGKLSFAVSDEPDKGPKSSKNQFSFK